ncbi:class I SAM-dependent methyltransferase [Salibacterium salarium]|uniref:Class I SAM-dependent methyltransferase n=1 Tax=Salibacterium salarium TaxID=284579 RepID=A0A428N6A6_9BACI|nr:class I SAM-dependent methyltransferase [Salibacterium salarium]RSL34004.1 class I SAM-dependent methyltransferase [Salibacterium salarium]
MQKNWNERFGADEYVYGEHPNAFIETQASRFEGNKKIAAFAEGEGRNAVFLAKQGHNVTTFDYAENGLQKTKNLAQRFGVAVETTQKDLIQDDVPSETYDGAVMVFGHFPKIDQKNVIDKLIMSVKPGGKVMLEVYSEEQLHYQTGGPKTKDMLYTPADLLEWTKDYNVLHFFYGEAEREEGTLHTGMAHVIQVVIEK